MRATEKVFVVATVGLAVLLGSTASWALPRKLLGGECNCLCVVDGGAGQSDLIARVEGLANQFANCGVYNSKTCNVADPATGGVRSGKTQNCCQVLDNGGCFDLRFPTTIQTTQPNLQSATLSTTTGGVTPPPPTSTTIAPTAPPTRTKP